ncbi:GGDEF domain-containing protein [Marinobacteraceae bacterium S3BR75-40.1]
MSEHRDLLSSSHHPDDVFHRLKVLRMIALLVAGFTLIFALINVMRGLPLVASIQLSASLISLIAYISTRKAQALPVWYVGYMLLFFSLLMVMIASPGVTDSAFIWALTIPIMSYLLMGKRLGLVVSAVFLVAANLIFIGKALALAGAVDWVATSNLILSSLAVLAFSHAYEIGRESAHRRLAQLASTDPLTHLGNRNRALTVFDLQKQRFIREGSPVSFILIDLDYFKRINDNHGHDAGDALLKHIALLIAARIRATDCAFRLGGEEFGIILADTRKAQATKVAEDLRRVIEAHTTTHRGTPLRITLTAGVAELGPDGDTFEAMHKAADRRLYRGKERGRNCVVA